MKAKDVMTSPVASLEPDATVLQAVHMMLQKRISGLPVIDKDGRLVGIVTEGDFLRRSETGTEQRRSRWLELLVGLAASRMSTLVLMAARSRKS